MRLVARLREAFGRMGVEPGHLKVIGLHDGSFGVANLVSSGTQPELSLPSRGQVAEAEVIVNARVAADPALIEEQVRRALAEVGQRIRGDGGGSLAAELPPRPAAADAPLRHGEMTPAPGCASRFWTWPGPP